MADGLLVNAEEVATVEEAVPVEEETQTGEIVVENKPVDVPVRPEHIDEQFWIQETGEINTEALAKSYKDLRTEFNKRNNDKVGDSIEDYATEEFFSQEGMAGMKDDPGMVLALESAQKAGMGVKQAQEFISTFMNGMSEFAPKPVDVQAELASLGKNGPHMVSGVKTWVDGMRNHGDINDEVHGEILKLGATAAGIKALNVLMNKSGVMNIPTGEAVSGTTHMSAEDWYTATYETHAEGGESRDAYNVRMRALGETIFGAGHGTFSGVGLGTGRR